MPQQVTNKRRATASTYLGLLLYLFANLALLVLKLAQKPPVAGWSWWRVTSLLWGPWVLTLGAMGLGVLRKGGRRP